MGFMDKMKDMAQQAQQAAATYTPNQGDMAYAQLASKLASSGVPCVAEVKSAAPTGQKDAGGDQWAIEVHVEGNGDPYDATVTQYIPGGNESMYQPGARFNAKADPDDRSRLLLFGQA
jgi:hypothetical protein